MLQIVTTELGVIRKRFHHARQPRYMLHIHNGLLISTWFNVNCFRFGQLFNLGNLFKINSNISFQ